MPGRAIGYDNRWTVGTAIDVVVAHSNYQDALSHCLSGLGGVQSIGFEAHTKEYGKYWDISLDENLPLATIGLPIAATKPGEVPRPRTGEIFDFQITTAPTGSYDCFAEQPIPRITKRRRNA